MRARTLRSLGGALFLLLFATGGAEALAREKHRSTLADLERANQRWKGARCRIRYDLKIKRGKNDEGWSRSPIMWYQERGEEPFHLIFEVSDRARLAAVMAGDFVPVGTEFVVEGWHLVRPGEQRGLALDMRFAAAPEVVARWWFKDEQAFSPETFPLQRLEQVERYMRIQAVALAAADERLAAVPAAGSAESAASKSGAAPAPAPSPSPSGAFKPFVKLLAAAVQPAQIAPGGEIDLVLSYEIGGVPPGAAFEVFERREILTGETSIARFEQPLARGAGTYTSSQRIRLPPQAARGLYTLRASIDLAGVSASGKALFAVE